VSQPPAQCLHLQELRDRFAALILREHQVLRHVVRRRLNKQIAAVLGITERTVKLQGAAMTTKLRMQSVAGLRQLVKRRGYLSLVPHPSRKGSSGAPASGANLSGSCKIGNGYHLKATSAMLAVILEERPVSFV
jgi:DNA-binding CsgD family transcriptional regulator